MGRCLPDGTWLSILGGWRRDRVRHVDVQMTPTKFHNVIYTVLNPGSGPFRYTARVVSAGEVSAPAGLCAALDSPSSRDEEAARSLIRFRMTFNRTE
jgi:hypothetical protein